jgi:hypothetical protein
MACVLRRCRELYNAGLQERRDAWQKCRGGRYHCCQPECPTAAHLAGPAPNTARCTPRSCGTCSPAWIGPSRRSSAAPKTVNSQALRASRVKTATTASPTSSSATVPRWRMASWSSRGRGGSPSGGRVRLRARPGRSPSAGKRAAGMSVSAVPRCPHRGASANWPRDGDLSRSGVLRHAGRRHPDPQPPRVPQG